MNEQVVVVEAVRGRDGKRYPAQLPPTREQLNERRWLAHQLVCGQGLSFRQAQAAMLARGIRRSLGAICQDVQRFECPVCAAPGQEPQQEPQQQPGLADAS